jgi:hypothetical protein
VVVDNVQDRDLGAVGQLPVGEIGLPTLVGLIGAKRSPRRPRPFLRLRKPRRDKIRQIVDTAGVVGRPPPSRAWRAR